MTLPIPSTSEIIEIIWIVNSKQSYWWKATILDIEDVNKGPKLARPTIEYEPGPAVDISSVYKVFFYSDMTIGEDTKIKYISIIT